MKAVYKSCLDVGPTSFLNFDLVEPEMFWKMEMIAMAAVILVLANLALGVVLWLWVRKLCSFPGFLGVPVIGNLFYFYRTLALFTVDSFINHLVSVAEKYGESGICFHVTYGYKISAIITSPEISKKLGVHPNLNDKPQDIYGGLQEFLRGPLTRLRSDDLWKQQRKEYNTFLRRYCVDNVYFNKMIKSADELVDTMLDSSPCDPRPISLALSHNNVLTSLGGIEADLAYDSDIVHKLERILNVASTLEINSNIMIKLGPILRTVLEFAFRKALKLRKLGLEKIYNTLILKKEPVSEPNLLLQLAARSIESNDGEQYLIREIQEMYFISSHSTASVLSNTIIILALQNDIQERAWREQCEIFGNDNRDPTIEDLERMQFLDRFIKECLRFLQPPFSARKASADVQIDGITIPRGAIVFYLYHYTNMDPKYWKDPKVFDPDRFLEESDALKYVYTPFGIGMRNCPGMYYATTTLKVTLSKILRRVKIRPAKDFRFEDIKYIGGILMEMDTYPLLRVKQRT